MLANSQNAKAEEEAIMQAVNSEFRNMADENSTEAIDKSISSSSMSESIIAAAGEAHEAVSNMYQDGGAGDMDVRAEISGSTEQRAAPEQHILKSLSIVEEEEEEEEEE